MNKINEILHKNRDENIDEILAFCHKYHDIYLYGSGCVGNQIKRYLLEESIQISGFIVSDGEREKNPLNDIPIFELSEIKRKETYGVIISTKRSSQEKIKQNLLRHNFKEEQIYEQKIYFQDSEEHSALKKLILPQIATGSFFGYTNLDDLGVKYHTDKNHQNHDYLMKYEYFLRPMREKEITLIELGVQHGGSLKTWGGYFKNAHIVGVDIDPDCQKFANDRTRIITTDLSDEKNICALTEENPNIIIDDASHFWSHQIKAFLYLFPSLISGGIYILEDLGTSFPIYKDKGYDDASINTYEFLLALNYCVTGGQKLIRGMFNKPIIELEDIVEKLASQIDMISFIRESCIIIKK